MLVLGRKALRTITPVCRFALLLVVLAGCRTVPEGGIHVPRGIEGRWLRNGSAEAFVSSRPYTRVLIFRRSGQASPLRLVPDDPFVGIRCWYMEPGVKGHALLPALQPATIETVAPNKLRITAEPETESGLQLITEVELDKNRPVLRLRHGFKNLRNTTRRISVWPLVVFPQNGIGLTPWVDKQKKGAPPRALLFYMGTRPDEPCISLGENALAVDFRQELQGKLLKIGANTDAGWAAFMWEGNALISSVPHDPDGDYPDGGSTVTFYHSGANPKRRTCEVEHVGPLRRVASGETVWLEQTLELMDAVDARGGDADAWLDAVERADPNLSE